MFYLAYRQLAARKKQTVLILLGILFGTMIYILIAGVQLGFRKYIADQLLNNTAHILITGSDNEILAEDLTPRFFDDAAVRWLVPPQGKRRESHLDSYLGWYQRLEREPEVLTFAPRFSIQAIASRANLKTSITLQGITPSRQMKVTGIEDFMKEGSLLDLEGGGNGIILGVGVMEKLGAKINDTIRLTTGTQEGSRPFKIRGVLDLGNQDMDDTVALGNLRDVQQLNRTPGRVTEIAVALTDIRRSESIANRWDALTDDKVEDWQKANATFMQMIRIQDIVRYIITLSILLVAAFGIYNVLSIMISQKKREIAILRAIGYAPRKILELFMIQGIFLGLVGAIGGMVVGYLLCRYFGSIDLGFRIGKGTSLLISYSPSIYATAFVAAQVAAFVASLLPALAASRLSPMQIIRSE